MVKRGRLREGGRDGSAWWKEMMQVRGGNGLGMWGVGLTII